MYVMPKDLRSLSPDTVPYTFDVDVIKDISNLKNEINDIVNVVDKSAEYYAEAVLRVSFVI